MLKFNIMIKRNKSYRNKEKISKFQILIRSLLKTFFNFHYLENFSLINKKKIEEYKKKNNLTIKYTKLIDGLDLKSKILVDLLLYRILKSKKIIMTYEVSTQELKYMAKNYNSNYKVTDGDTSIDTSLYKNLYPGFIDYEIPVFMFHHGLVLMSNNVKSYLKDKDCIDGGSSILDSAVIFSLHYPFKKIHSFDLNEKNINFGKKLLNKKYLNIKNIKLNLKGLWSKEGTAEISGQNNLTKISSVNTNTELNTKNNLITIDAYSASEGIKIGFIKLDLEGAEFEAVKGCKNTIKKDLPILSISIYHNLKDFFEIKPMIEEIAPNEYDFYIRKLAPLYSQLETYLICIPKKSGIKLLDWNDIEIFG